MSTPTRLFVTKTGVATTGVVAVAVLGLMTTAFGGRANAQTGATKEAPLKVVVTIKPVHALALQVLDGIAKPALIVDGTASPHTYALKPSDAKLFNDADIVFRVSEGLEPFTAKVVKSIPKSVQVITFEKVGGDKVEGIRTLPRRQGATFEKLDHSGHGHKGHNHGAKVEPGTRLDGHLWLDPTNAKAIVAEIARVASAKRPSSAALIARNAATAMARLDALDMELAQVLAPAKDKPYIVFHDALQYLEVRYGLTPAGSVTVDPDVPPSAKRLNEVRAKIKSLAASCVFGEPGYETKILQAIVEGSTAKLGSLDAEGLTIATGPDAYDALMRGLAKSMRACLAPTS